MHQLDDIGLHHGLAQHLAAAERRDVVASDRQADLAVDHDPHLLAVLALPENGLAVLEMPVVHLSAALLSHEVRPCDDIGVRKNTRATNTDAPYTTARL